MRSNKENITYSGFPPDLQPEPLPPQQGIHIHNIWKSGLGQSRLWLVSVPHNSDYINDYPPSQCQGRVFIGFSSREIKARPSVCRSCQERVEVSIASIRVALFL